MTHVPAFYGPIMDHVLSVPLEIGQGGRWEATPATSWLALVRLEASLSSHLGNEIKATFDERGKDIVREAATRYGRFRGECIRRTVESKGLALDIPNMWKWWDLPVTDARDEERENDDLAPDFNSFEVSNCAFAEVYGAIYDAELRGLHCEAMHTAAFTSYHPAMDFWLPSLMPRGEARCLFRLRIPPDEAEKAARRATGKDLPRALDDLTSAYSLVVRQIAIIYHFFADALLDTCGQGQTDEVLRRAVAAWGTYRGQEMRRVHLDKGWPLDLRSFATYYDDPSAGEAWLAQNVSVSPAEYHIEITRSPWFDWFTAMATGRRAAILWEEALPAQARAYNPGITVTIPHLLERGDSVSEFHYTLPA
jgi:hypothetical protein